MKKRYFLTAALAALAFLGMDAQTLNVVTGKVTYAFPAGKTGDMTYQSGKTLTIMGKTFDVSEISKMYVSADEVDSSTVAVSYNGAGVTMTIAGNVARYVSPTISNAHVTINQGEDVGTATCGEITYSLAGASTDGEFTLNGSYKASMEFRGLTLANASGAPVNIQNGKRISLSIKKDTENTLVDSKNGEQKGCLVCKGHLELKGKGVLNVTGNTGHAIYAKEYVELKNCTVNVLSAVKDGINCNQYFTMESGVLNISNVGDDGIQVSYKDKANPTSEDTGVLSILGGKVRITNYASKALKAANAVEIAPEADVEPIDY